jgi:PAS domain S-box-containing protein
LILLLLTSKVAKKQTGTASSPLMLQQKLDAAKENFSILFNLLPDPAMIIDKTGNFLEVSDSVTKETGYTKEEFLATSFLNSSSKQKKQSQSCEKSCQKDDRAKSCTIRN